VKERTRTAHGRTHRFYIAQVTANAFDIMTGKMRDRGRTSALTLKPRPTKRRATAEPMKPLAPVTRTVSPPLIDHAFQRSAPQACGQKQASSGIPQMNAELG
jgi:hypothetical protein